MTYMELTYTILIPAYNAESSLAKLIESILRHTADFKPEKIIVVDDGSGDNTVTVARKLPVELISLPQNRGKGAALKEGYAYFLNHCRSGYLITLDADLQHPPENIGDFLQTAEKHNSAVIIGQRSFTPPAMPLMRVLSNTLTSQIISGLTGLKIPDSQCGYRMIRRDVLSRLELRENGFQLESEFFFRCRELKVRIDYCPIPTVYNDYGSSMHHVRDTLKFIQLMGRELFKR
ncbi:MAG TPA: glycosyltransferase family 2 protein [Caldithrix abyssi]|uniref:Glycosyltransferase family 2 protein n=1 Tax=Caldithrix abyssi TaxID=187145 RepID=A0A7V1LN98_CALAY|nr:glycosyltransferase family 2 protein [Caldithrix abyssi]